MSLLVTGEAVALDVQTAGVPSRMLAAVIDGVAQGVLLAVLFFMMGVFGGEGSGAALAATAVVSYALVGLGYPVLFETLMRGRTPGKAALGIRVVRDDAGPIRFRHAFVRGLIGFIVERPGFTFYSAAVLTSLLNERGKRLGDLAAGTMVIQERVVAPPAVMAYMPPQLAGWASTLDLSRLSDELALSVRTFLARSPTLTEHAREALGQQLTAAVAAVVTPVPPPETPGWAYLSAVLAERRLRAQAQLHPSSAAFPGPAPAFAPAPQPEAVAPEEPGFALPS